MRDQYQKETDEACKNPAQIQKRYKWSRNQEAKQAAMFFFIVIPHKTQKQTQLKKPKFCSTSFFRLQQMQISPIHNNSSTSKAQIFEVLQYMKSVNESLQIFLIKPQAKMEFLIAFLNLSLTLSFHIYMSSSMLVCQPIIAPPIFAHLLQLFFKSLESSTIQLLRHTSQSPF